MMATRSQVNAKKRRDECERIVREASLAACLPALPFCHVALVRELGDVTSRIPEHVGSITLDAGRGAIKRGKSLLPRVTTCG